ncbi:RRM_1 domain-containing protein/RRM_6 domain-containing protein [Cephalotus follicularis]|uniref:RRM_1 domain-containing protein/RRM_6 domain-containing protein n=1 Tax=Cephalotus follicularis TaxID=3775 RepID=A0A1Q3CX49_CEPFO|nr:RRM_1 domain-containing protein/RRM_6 domain-containing protein [Cephalotus follicularis]
MGRSSRRKEKYEKRDELSQDHCDVETAARTRPFSFDEIMLKRKNKELYENVKEQAVEAGNTSGDGVIKGFSDCYEFDKEYRHKKDLLPGVKKHSLEEFVNKSARKNEERHSTKDDTRKKNEDKNAREIDKRKKVENISTMDDRRKKEENDFMKVEISKWKVRESRKPETNLTAEMKKDIRNKDYIKIDKQIESRKREHPRNGTETEAANKQSIVIKGRDRHADRRIGRSEREDRRKYQNGDEEKNQGRSATGKLDQGKGDDLKTSERKERKESSRSHHEESRLKRRRSRSREHENENGRSVSLSPRTHKRAPHHGQEHEEQSSHSLRSRSNQSDIDKKRITSNGSSAHYRRPGGYTSGLGGYSPRKRKSEAAAKTPSPTNRSPEKKSAKWDMAPSTTDRIFSGSLSNFQFSNQTASSNVLEVVSTVPVASTPMRLLAGALPATKQDVSIDSVQLTQATRPIRRLHVENLPTSASENALMECLNNLLLSSGISHIQGIQPCISCIVHRERGQAVVEFLTPEYASAALSFNGSSFSGSTLKIRRPKDFIEVATDESEKSEAAVDAISDVVKDSPHTIFIGGISNALSSEMLMDITSAFGSLKMYHFEVNCGLHKPCAFVEYVDHSVTLKACAGLNGMKLGGKVITAVQVVPSASSLENNVTPLFYGIPDNAKPLLKKPTQVLKLKNVLNPEALSSLSEAEVEETLEDVRLECSRFGIVKSVNVIKFCDRHIPSSEACEVNGIMRAAGISQSLGHDETDENPATLEEVENCSKVINAVEIFCEAEEVEEVNEIVEGSGSFYAKPVDGLREDELSQLGQLDKNITVEDQARESESETATLELPCQLNNSKDESDSFHDKIADITQMEETNVGNKLTAEEDLNMANINGKLGEASGGSNVSVGKKSDKNKKGDSEQQDCDVIRIFEPGSVFVEYGREEASCTAAHCLLGRLFDGRVVTVEYVPLDLYRAWFSN